MAGQSSSSTSGTKSGLFGFIEIRNLESITVGVAEFENKINEFVQAGGRQPPQDEMKSDLDASRRSWAIISRGACRTRPSPTGRSGTSSYSLFRRS